jgi:hypothetical protein
MTWLFSFLFPWLLVLWLLRAIAARVMPRLNNAAGHAPERVSTPPPRGLPIPSPHEVGRGLGRGVRSIQQWLWHDAPHAPRWKWRPLLAFGFVSAVVVSLPVRGISLGRWLAGLNLPPSIPLLGFLAGQVWQDFAGTELFRAQDRQAGWIFGGLAGTVLYPLALGLGNFDPYAWGWTLSALFPIVAVVTMYLIWTRNRFGVLLLLAILACDARLLDSPNFWDYLVDPVYWLLSLALLAKGALKKNRCLPI